VLLYNQLGSPTNPKQSENERFDYIFTQVCKVKAICTGATHHNLSQLLNSPHYLDLFHHDRKSRKCLLPLAKDYLCLQSTRPIETGERYTLPIIHNPRFSKSFPDMVSLVDTKLQYVIESEIYSTIWITLLSIMRFHLATVWQRC
jgi:hypothetical protein